jgi:hypothetical protein
MNSFAEHPERAMGERPKRRPFDIDDLYLHRKPSEVHCVPGLDVAACAVRCVDREKNGYVSRIWSFALDDSGGMQITGPASATIRRAGPTTEAGWPSSPTGPMARSRST